MNLDLFPVRVLGLLTLSSFINLGYSITQYNIFDHCNGRFSMIGESTHDVLLYYEFLWGNTQGYFKCTMEVWGYFDGGGLAMHFTSFNINDTKTYIEIRQGDSWDKGRPIEGLPSRLSGTFNQLNKVYLSDWMDVFIQVSGEQAPYRKRIFELAINHFHTGPCTSWEKQCDNGRCIDESLQCNGYNPCGDFSDCDDNKGLSPAMIAVIFICSIGFAVIVVVWYQCWACRKKKQRMGESDTFRYAQSSVGRDDQQDGTDEPVRPHRDTTHLREPRTSRNTTTVSPRYVSNRSPRNHRNTTSISLRDFSNGSTSQRSRRGVNLSGDDLNENGISVSVSDEPPSYNDVTTQQDSPRVSDNVIDNIRDRIGLATSDFNSAVVWRDMSSATNRHPRATNEQVLDVNRLPSYSDVIENESVYNLTLSV